MTTRSTAQHETPANPTASDCHYRTAHIPPAHRLPSTISMLEATFSRTRTERD
ncbi:hypothetical protein [Streptomyces sp. Act143]|uniref:hypothetical protein n=1 Tax=Streptomyces sp. Act143 TaxID=2200760 RepID=UPI0015E7FF2D|nr:hypothetical protein [Streptomyces sp. Act143]